MKHLKMTMTQSFVSQSQSTDKKWYEMKYHDDARITMLEFFRHI
jgi:hypothetical protein